MSLPNTLFYSTRKDAIAHAKGEPATVNDLYEFGGITDLDISIFFSIAAGEEFDFDLHEILPMDELEDCEVFELPVRLVEVLAAKNEADIQPLAIEWAATEELQCDPADLSPIVAKLIELSKKVGGNRIYFSA